MFALSHEQRLYLIIEHLEARLRSGVTTPEAKLTSSEALIGQASSLLPPWRLLAPRCSIPTVTGIRPLRITRNGRRSTLAALTDQVIGLQPAGQFSDPRGRALIDPDDIGVDRFDHRAS